MQVTTLAVLAMALLLALALGVEAEDVRFRPPQGWVQAKQANGSVALQPPDVAPGKSCAVMIFPDLEGDVDAVFDEGWRLMTASAKAARGGKPARRTSPNGFEIRSTSAVLEAPGVPPSHVHFCAVQSGTKVRRVLFAADSAEVYKEYFPAVKAMIDSAYARAPAAKDADAPDEPVAKKQAGRNLPAKADGPGFEGCFYSARIGFNPLGGRGEVGRKVDYMSFLPNGTVYLGLPIGGPLEILANETESPNFGRYTMDADAFTIVYNHDKILNLRLTHKGARLPSGKVEVNGVEYTPYAPLDGLKLDGTWAWRWEGGESVIRFTKDGRFSERGLRNTVSDDEFAYPNWPKLPESGSGTYSIRLNTLRVKYDNGPTRQIFFTIPDPKDPVSISINTYPHDRQR